MKIVMKVSKVDEAGYEAALRGLSFNKKQEKHMGDVAYKLAGKGFGHDKFLESIYVWLEVTAPRYWWQEADTYRMSTKQSESTMHTLISEIGTIDETAFEGDVSSQVIAEMTGALTIQDSIEQLVRVKQILPESFLQRRMWCLNYKSLTNILIQRRNHRLPHWQIFCKEIKNQVDHPELLPEVENA